MAYWFPSGSGRFENGSIVTLRNDKLVPAKDFATGDIFLVVSDDHAKWKGGVRPSPEDEAKGHWCAWLGQVPLKTNGPVKSGAHIGEHLPLPPQPNLDARKGVAGCMAVPNIILVLALVASSACSALPISLPLHTSTRLPR